MFFLSISNSLPPFSQNKLINKINKASFLYENQDIKSPAKLMVKPAQVSVISIYLKKIKKLKFKENTCSYCKKALSIYVYIPDSFVILSMLYVRS